MEWVVLCVRASELMRSTGMDCAENMVVGEEVVKVQILNRFTN